jgi:hypothetical protein
VVVIYVRDAELWLYLAYAMTYCGCVSLTVRGCNPAHVPSPIAIRRARSIHPGSQKDADTGQDVPSMSSDERMIAAQGVAGGDWLSAYELDDGEYQKSCLTIRR